MKKKVKLSLITMFIVLVLLITGLVSASAYSTCTATINDFKDTYTDDIGCDYTNVPITLSSNKATTSISSSTGNTIESYVAAWKSSGKLIDSSTHRGTQGRSSATVIWLVANPVRTQHDGIIISGSAGGCRGYHTKQYR